jgi:hypothetical protein
LRGFLRVSGSSGFRDERARLDVATGGRAAMLARLVASFGLIRPTPVQNRQRFCGSRVRLVFATRGRPCVIRRAPIWFGTGGKGPAATTSIVWAHDVLPALTIGASLSWDVHGNGGRPAAFVAL